MKSNNKFSLAIHGGAGLAASNAADVTDGVRQFMLEVLEEGRTLLDGDATALEVVQHCVRKLEDNPYFNAGYGAYANRLGQYELDAAIMDGANLRAGAVAAVRNVRNPVELAYLIMQQTPHVMLSGEGASDFARAQNIRIELDAYFQEATALRTAPMDSGHGTVGAVARDRQGNLAAATSTGGWGTKMPGRIGDSPLIGAGTYADNRSCAVSCTGRGEDFIRTAFAKHLCMLVELNKLDIKNASSEALSYLIQAVNGEGGFISIDKNGDVGIAYTTEMIRYGYIEHEAEAHAGFTL